MQRTQAAIKRIKGEANRQRPGRIVVAKQDLDNPDIYRDHGGRVYNRAELDELGQRVQLITVEYTANWRDTEDTPL